MVILAANNFVFYDHISLYLSIEIFSVIKWTLLNTSRLLSNMECLISTCTTITITYYTLCVMSLWVKSLVIKRTLFFHITGVGDTQQNLHNLNLFPNQGWFHPSVNVPLFFLQISSWQCNRLASSRDVTCNTFHD